MVDKLLLFAVLATDVRLSGDWRVAVKGTQLSIAPLPMTEVADERHESLPEFDFPSKNGWRRGARLSGVIAEECTVNGALDPASVVVRSGGRVFRRGVDYEFDSDWGTVGRVPGGAIAPGQAVSISYSYARQRIDSVVVTPAGKLELRVGVVHTVTPEQPALARGERRLANVLVSGRDAALGPNSLFPVLEEKYPETVRAGTTLLPETMEKLKSGAPLKILAWGDSVTTYKRWQTMFAERLRAQFPREVITEAWGGRNTGSYLREPPGSEHNYAEKVLAQKPDLIVSEFVNDASLTQAQVEERYSRLLADFQTIGAEWIILTPHYVRPDWMKLDRQREVDEDPRPYVKGVREFGARHNVAVADASLRYGRLWRRGIPYLTLMENSINHPNVFGHTLFADALMALFR